MSRWRVIVAGALSAITVAVVPGVATAAKTKRKASRDTPIVIVTVPAARNLRFELAGRVYVTGRRGRTSIPARDLQRLPHSLRAHRLLLAQRIRLLPNHRPDGSMYRVERWYSNTHVARPPLEAAIDLYRPVRFSLVSRAGRPISLDLLDAFQMKRIDGAVINLSRSQLARPVLLQASRVVPLNGALVSKKLLYRIQRVAIGGNNLVNRAQQSFEPSDSLAVRLRLLFYSVRFQARDTLFGFPIGSGIRLVYPNRRVQVYRFQGHGQVALAALPRGTYHVSVVAPGLSPASPVSITRDHLTQLKVLSYLDIAVLTVLFLGVLVSLALIRRRGLRRRLVAWWPLRRGRAVRRSA
jgi:hypothetical protein